MNRYIVVPAAAVSGLISAIDASFPLPQRGTHVGRGPHVDLDDGTLRGYTVTECARADADDGTAAVVVSIRGQSSQAVTGHALLDALPGKFSGKPIRPAAATAREVVR